MISCIICSRASDISETLKENIATTIGCQYELIVLNNSRNEYSMFSAYNEGIRRAKGDILCFMHEDIFYCSINWGISVTQYFMRNDIGLLGVVGTHFLPLTESGWYHPMLYSGGCIQNINGNRTKKITKNFSSKDAVEVVAVDGMWFCIPSVITKLICFDETTFSSFHFYDLDICMQIRGLDLKILVIYDVLIEHSSLGSFDMQWYSDSVRFVDKWKNQLPSIAGVTISREEIEIRTEFVKQIMVWQNAYAQCNERLSQMYKSYAYRIGKFIMNFFTIFKRNV